MPITALRVFVRIVELLKPFPHRCQRWNVPITAARELSVPGSHGSDNLAHVQTYPRIVFQFEKIVYAIPSGKIQRQLRPNRDTENLTEIHSRAIIPPVSQSTVRTTLNFSGGVFV